MRQWLFAAAMIAVFGGTGHANADGKFRGQVTELKSYGNVARVNIQGGAGPNGWVQVNESPRFDAQFSLLMMAMQWNWPVVIVTNVPGDDAVAQEVIVTRP